MIHKLLFVALVLAQDAAAELKALEAEYDKALDAHIDAVDKVKDKKEWDKQYREKHPCRTFGPRFGDLARRARGSEPGFKAGMHVVRDAWFLEDEASLRAILEDMASSYKGSALLEQMMPYAAGAAVCKRWSWSEALIRSMTKEETRPLRAAALYDLGTVLRLHGTPEQRAEGLLLFKEIQRDYADLPHARQVEGFFFEQEHLQIGKTSPDFEATDQDGQKFRLSDYRGKVVVIDFWGFW
jgi:AhpC/TSA family protein